MELRAKTLMEAIGVAHLSSYVEGPFDERSGVMIVGPPGVLKSTFLSVLDRLYRDAVVVSDINARSLTELRDQMASGTIRTLVIPELGKLYQRNADTAANVEGALQALVAEGFRSAAFEDSRVNRLTARCTVMSALTTALQSTRFKDWEESGFNRRFLWILVRLKNPYDLEKAVKAWELVDFGVKRMPAAPLQGTIPNKTTEKEREWLLTLVKHQPGAGAHSTQQAMLVKMFAVWKWWYEQEGEKNGAAAEAIREFSAALWKGGAELIL